MSGPKISRAVVTVLFLVQLVNLTVQIAVPGTGHVGLAVGCLVIVIGFWLITNQAVRDAERRKTK